MTILLFEPDLLPFTIALGVMFGLLFLELLALMFGGSLMAGGEAEVDIDMDIGADADLDFDIDADLADFDADFDLDGVGAEGAELGEIDAAGGAETGVPGGILSWLGLGQVPFLIWLGVFLALFGLGGVIAQSVLKGTLGFALPPALASIAVGVPVLGITRNFARGFARLFPKVETQALSQNHLGRRRGVISQGTAARGRPAEVRVADRFGNMHYLRAEPLRDGVELKQGTEVLVLRKSLNEGYRLVALGE
jgi:hypothetical protein